MSTRARWVAIVALLAAVLPGCHRKEFVRDRTVSMDPPLVSAEPALTAPTPAEPILVDPNRVSLADRHPLFRKPAEYYESSGPSPLRKMAAATFIGVPAGILGEMRQIVVGRPAVPERRR